MMSLIQMTDAFKALTDLTRLRMVRLLVASRVEIGVSEFVRSLQGQPYNVSKQLKILEQAGLVLSRKEGRHVYYRLGSDDAGLVGRLFQLIADLPDSGSYFAMDLQRYERREAPKEVVVAGDDGSEPADGGEAEELPSHLL